MSNLQNLILSSSLEENINIINEVFKNDATLLSREFYNQANNIRCIIFFLDGMVDASSINDNIILPIIEDDNMSDLNPIEYLKNHIIAASKCESNANVKELANSLLVGDTVLFLDGVAKGLIIGSAGFKTRNIEEPETETIVRGPREGFTESLVVNTSLIRRKIKSTDLKFKYITIGDRTNTTTCVCYIESLASDRILNELLSQLENIDIDGILDVNYIQEYIDKQPYSIFETTRVTERPDIVAANLLEGRIALIVDGTPVVATMPFLFIEIFQFPEDYYTNYYFASLNRIMRLLGFVATISIPAVYLALVTFHQEIIPTPLLMSIYASRLAVPLPTLFEIIVLSISFEVLREAGGRMRPSVGQTVSIVGALVLGSAAVDARLVSAPVIIVVGLSGITSFMVPDIIGPSTIIKFIFIGLAAILGLYGYILGISFLLMHLISLKSFGVPIMTSFTSMTTAEMKDTHIRAPRWAMKYRPKILGQKNPVRTSRGEDK